MLYAILCYNDDRDVFSWSKEKDDEVMGRLQVVHDRLEAQGKLGPALRLESVKTARTYRKTPAGVMDGPFAETKEQLLGFYTVDVGSMDEALEIARQLSDANPGLGCYEVRPIRLYVPGKTLEADRREVETA
jgi:hypothetical protein